MHAQPWDPLGESPMETAHRLGTNMPIRTKGQTSASIRVCGCTALQMKQKGGKTIKGGPSTYQAKEWEGQPMRNIYLTGKRGEREGETIKGGPSIHQARRGRGTTIILSPKRRGRDN